MASVEPLEQDFGLWEPFGRVLEAGFGFWEPLRPSFGLWKPFGRVLEAGFGLCGASGTGFWPLGAIWEGPGGPIWGLGPSIWDLGPSIWGLGGPFSTILGPLFGGFLRVFLWNGDQI